jgi:hypothetical protein
MGDLNVSRRELLGRIVPLGAIGVAGACTSGPSSNAGTRIGPRPLALIYRGPAGCPGCAEAVAALLRRAPAPYRTEYCGPDEPLPLSAATLARASLYAQPGGGDDLDAAWMAMDPFADTLRRWIRDGGNYVGFCMGGFLAGSDPGFGILPGDSGDYISSSGATVHDEGDALVTVRWGNQERRIYFQGGPYFTVSNISKATVLATYTNGLIAAMVASYGDGRVGVTGPHPEAPRSWYREAGLTVPDPMPLDLGYDLVRTTVGGR